MSELKYTEEQFRDKVKEAVAEEINKMDKDGEISELNEKTSLLENEKNTILAEKEELEKKIEELQAKFDGYKSDEDVSALLEEHGKSVEAEITRYFDRLTEITEAGVELEDEDKTNLRSMSDEDYAILKKMAFRKAETEEKEIEETEEKEEVGESKAKASEKPKPLKSEAPTNGANAETEEKDERDERIKALLGKAIGK